MARPFELDILSAVDVGREGGFLYVRRHRLHNLRPDGSRSREWLLDYVDRAKGVDAVVVVLHRESGDGLVEVLLRECLRPALVLGRPPARVPLPDDRDLFQVSELVAGIIEEGEIGLEAVRRRAVEEAWEEAGVRVAPGAVELLGPGVFPSPGMTPERFWLVHAPVVAAAVVAGEAAAPTGDGSPMEEGGRVAWVALDEALARCARGDIVDMKTELGLRRFAERLAGAR